MYSRERFSAYRQEFWPEKGGPLTQIQSAGRFIDTAAVESRAFGGGLNGSAQH
jgi:hypothetical protein